MAGHASGRLLIICAVAVFLFYLRTCCWNYNISDAPPVPFWRSCNLIARVLPRCNRIKFPVGEWSKHGRTAIILPESQYDFRVVEILLGGDIQPHPGPYLNRSIVNQRGTLTAKQTPRNSTKNQVAIGHLNVRSMVSREKFILVSHTITFNDYDIFAISETWLDSSITDMDIHIPGYVMFRQDRDKKGGGLAVYVKDIYKASVIKKSSLVTENLFQQLWIKVQCKKLKSFLLCAAYRPPDTPIGFLDDLGNALIDCLLPGLEVILVGDLNCNLMDSCVSGRALSDFCVEFNLTQLVKEPTRVTDTSQTLIDVALTTNTNIIDTCDVKPAALSDHSLVCLILKLKSPRPRCTFITTRSYKNYNREKFVDDLANVPFHG
jgi:hypothetical protein